MPIRGIASNTPLNVRLMRTSAAAPLVLAGVDVKALQEKLAAAESLLDAGKYEEAATAYRAVLAAAPALTAVHLQIGRAERGLRRYDDAVASFGRVPEGDPARERARAEIALTEIERGQPDAAETALAPALAGPAPGREALFAAGELARARRQDAEAAGFYRRAIEADPDWSRARLALARVEVARGNRDAAIAELAKVVADDAGSPEAAEAKALLDTLQK
jgi:tetratricopeptide (TPR) repeat protein